jgi:hypothetical protein
MPFLNYFIYVWRIQLQKILNNSSCAQNALVCAPRSLVVGDAPASPPMVLEKEWKALIEDAKENLFKKQGRHP